MTSEFEIRRQARIDRLHNAASRARRAGEAKLNAASALASGIPLGQPILVGHHSERRARRDAERIHNNTGKGLALLDEAAQYERRAKAAEENDAIYRDDPEAVEKLREKLAEAEVLCARWKSINAALRKRSDEALKALALTAKEKRHIQFAPCGTGFMVTNAAANIRRIKVRIAELAGAQP